MKEGSRTGLLRDVATLVLLASILQASEISLSVDFHEVQLKPVNSFLKILW